MFTEQALPVALPHFGVILFWGPSVRIQLGGVALRALRIRFGHNLEDDALMVPELSVVGVRDGDSLLHLILVLEVGVAVRVKWNKFGPH